MPRTTIPVGTRFTRLLVFGPSEPKNGKSASRVGCDCGVKLVVLNTSLQSGNTKSCGCLCRENIVMSNYVHGHSFRGDNERRTYRIWKNIKLRCRNRNNPNYLNYGAKGIDFCDRWESFTLFLEDMGECPANMSIDRIDNKIGYFKENCRWATRGQQSRNTSRNRVFTVNGITACFADLCAAFKMKIGTARGRLDAGWPIDKIFSEPINPFRKKDKSWLHGQ